MTDSPELDEFRRRIDALRKHGSIAPLVKRGEVHFEPLTLEQVAKLLSDDAAYYFLLAAAGLNRTTLKKSVPEGAQIVEKRFRRAYTVKSSLPVRKLFDDVMNAAVVLRRGDLKRRTKGAVEALFRERLHAERIPILMSPPTRSVPGILIGKRKPDGVYPDPAEGNAPIVYLEIKNVSRVADDIQKRLYEIAEASLEMKFLYGSLELRGLELRSTQQVIEASTELRARLRQQILRSRPTVAVVMLCSQVEAGRYREGAEAFVDRVFFQEEIDECLAFLKEAVRDTT